MFTSADMASYLPPSNARTSHFASDRSSVSHVVVSSARMDGSGKVSAPPASSFSASIISSATAASPRRFSNCLAVASCSLASASSAMTALALAGSSQSDPSEAVASRSATVAARRGRSTTSSASVTRVPSASVRRRRTPRVSPSHSPADARARRVGARDVNEQR